MPSDFGDAIQEQKTAVEQLDDLGRWVVTSLREQADALELPEETEELVRQWFGLSPEEILRGAAGKLRDDLESEIAPVPSLAFIGPTNAGKSTLTNLLFGRPLATVGAGTGTTTETAHYTHRMGVDVLDTPGFLGPDAEVEREVEALLPTMDIRVLVLDVTAFRGDDARLALCLHELAPITLAVLNKIDLPPANEFPSVIRQIRQNLPTVKTIEVSATRGDNISLLIQAIYEALPDIRQQLLFIGWLNDRQEAIAAEIEALGSAKHEAGTAATQIVQEIEHARDQAALLAIKKAAAAAGVIGVTPIPGPDVIPLVALQHRLLVDLASIYGHEGAYSRLGIVIVPLALGFVGREAFRQTIKVVPGPGDLAAGAIAAAGSYAVGTMAMKVFQGDLPEEDVQQILDEELEKAFEMYRSNPEGAE